MFTGVVIRNIRTVRQKSGYIFKRHGKNVHDIELTSDVSILLGPYRTSLKETEILKGEIKRMLELEVIIEGESNYTSSLIFANPQCTI